MTTQTRAERRKEFIREITGIVLGVLIALSLGAVATAIGWRLEAREAREALALELGEIIGQGTERVAAYQCIERRFDAVAAVLDGAAATGTLPPVGDIGDPPFRTWSTGVWDSTISSDTASHMDRETLDNLSGVYEFMTVLNHEVLVETDTWSTLYTIVGPGRSITPDEIATLRQALSRARMAHRMIVLSAQRLHQIADAYDLPYDRGTVSETAKGDFAARYCAPIGPPGAAGYGSAPFARAYQRVRDNPILRGDQ